MTDSYTEVRRRLCRNLEEATDPNYIRLYPMDPVREGPRGEPVACTPDETLENMLTSVMPSSYPGQYSVVDRRVLWYEKTEYSIRDFELNEEVRVTWRPDGGAPLTMDQQNTEFPWAHTRAASILVPFNSKYSAVIDRTREKLEIPSTFILQIFEVRNHRITRKIAVDEVVQRFSVMFGGISPNSGTSCEVRISPVQPLREDHVFVSVCHFAKEGKQRVRRDTSRLHFFDVPFIIQMHRDGEQVGSIRDRIQRHIDMTGQEYEDWQLYELTEVAVALEDVESEWAPNLDTLSCLAIEHKNTAQPTQRKTTGFYSKPLKIRS